MHARPVVHNEDSQSHVGRLRHALGGACIPQGHMIERPVHEGVWASTRCTQLTCGHMVWMACMHLASAAR